MKTSFLSGIYGGGIVVAIFLIALFCLNIFNYNISVEKVKVHNLNISDTTKVYSSEEIIDACSGLKQSLVEKLHQEKLILSPQEYTNNVVNYYNNLLLILSVIIAAFSILSFIYFKNQTREQVQDTLEDEQFLEKIAEKLSGKVEGRFQNDLDEIKSDLHHLNNRQAEKAENEQITL